MAYKDLLDKLGLSEDEAVSEYDFLQIDHAELFKYHGQWDSFDIKDLICMRFGLDLHGANTLKDCGKVFRVSASRIRQVEQKALRSMQHPDRIRLMKEVK